MFHAVINKTNWTHFTMISNIFFPKHIIDPQNFHFLIKPIIVLIFVCYGWFFRVFRYYPKSFRWLWFSGQGNQKFVAIVCPLYHNYYTIFWLRLLAPICVLANQIFRNKINLVSSCSKVPFGWSWRYTKRVCCIFQYLDESLSANPPSCLHILYLLYPLPLCELQHIYFQFLKDHPLSIQEMPWIFRLIQVA